MFNGCGNSRRCGRARGSAPACPPAPASRARFPPRACLRRRRRSATRCRPGPIAASKRRRASICAPVRSGRGADPPRPPVTGAVSQAMVTRGASWPRSQAQRSRSPASNWRRVSSPRENSQPSGDSARFTDRIGRAPAGGPGNFVLSLAIARSRSNRVFRSAVMLVSRGCESLRACHIGETVGQKKTYLVHFLELAGHDHEDQGSA